MNPELLSRTNAPVGTRCLVQNGLLLYSPLLEVVVVEWSAGDRVKLRYLNGTEMWQERMPYLIEVLDSPPDAARDAAEAAVESLKLKEDCP